MSSNGAKAIPRCANATVSNLMLWPILRTPGASSSGFKQRERLRFGDLPLDERAAAEQVVGADAMPDRDVAGFARP